MRFGREDKVPRNTKFFTSVEEKYTAHATLSGRGICLRDSVFSLDDLSGTEGKEMVPDARAKILVPRGDGG